MARIYGLNDSDKNHFLDLVRGKSRFKQTRSQRRRRNNSATPRNSDPIKVMLTETVPAASYSDGVLTPSTFTAELFVLDSDDPDGDDWKHDSEKTKECTNPFATAVTIGSGKGRFAWVTRGGELLCADCTEVDLGEES